MPRTLVLLLYLAALPLAAATPSVATIDLRGLVQAINTQRCRLVDCREAGAFAKTHLRGAIHPGSLSDDQLSLFLPLGPADPVVLVGADARDQGWKAVAQRLDGLGAKGLKRFAAGYAGLDQLRGFMEKGAMQERPAKLPGALKFKGRTYLVHVPAIEAGVKPALLVWCHPASGTPGPEFQFWQQSQLFEKNAILLCPKAWGQGWVPALDERFVHELVAKVMEDHGVDPAKVVFGGHSSGAIFTLSYALRHPDRYRHLVPACGMLQPGTAPKAGENAPPVSLYHSKNDKVFNWQQLEATKKELESQGFDVHLTEDNQGHSIGRKLVERVKEILASLAE